MALVNMDVFEQYAYGTVTETIAQQVELFNAATNNAITLIASSNEGDYSSQTFWKEIAGITRRRNAYGSGAVTGVALSQDSMTSVKVAGGTPPILFNPSQLTWIQKSPEEAGVVIGEQLGLGMVKDQINSIIACLVAAISGQASLVNDGTAATLSRSRLNLGVAAFGDRSGDINTWVTHSKPMHDLFGENIANASRLFAIDNINVIEDGFGRRLIMTDSPALTYTDTGPRYRTLGLVNGAASVEDNGDLFTNLETTNGDENIQRSWQAEYTFNAKLKGYAWDKANGGASPTDAALATAANWDLVHTDLKNTSGVLINTL